MNKKSMKIPLAGRFSHLSVKIDAEDYYKVNKYEWYLSKSGYPYTKIVQQDRQKSLLLHRFVINELNPQQIVDHIDNDRLNCCKSNLRRVTPSQNQQNRKKFKNCSSQYKGVSWNEAKEKWSATITNNGEKYNLGYYDDEIEAAKAYDYYCKKFFGEFGKPNGLDLTGFKPKKIKKLPKVGERGVLKRGKKWQARIQYKGKRKSLGYFDTKEDAQKAYAEAYHRIRNE